MAFVAMMAMTVMAGLAVATVMPRLAVAATMTVVAARFVIAVGTTAMRAVLAGFRAARATVVTSMMQALHALGELFKTQRLVVVLIEFGENGLRTGHAARRAGTAAVRTGFSMARTGAAMMRAGFAMVRTAMRAGLGMWARATGMRAALGMRRAVGPAIRIALSFRATMRTAVTMVAAMRVARAVLRSFARHRLAALLHRRVELFSRYLLVAVGIHSLQHAFDELGCLLGHFRGHDRAVLVGVEALEHLAGTSVTVGPLGRFGCRDLDQRDDHNGRQQGGEDSPHSSCLLWNGEMWGSEARRVFAGLRPSVGNL